MADLNVVAGVLSGIVAKLREKGLLTDEDMEDIVSHGKEAALEHAKGEYEAERKRQSMGQVKKPSLVVAAAGMPC